MTIEDLHKPSARSLREAACKADEAAERVLRDELASAVTKFEQETGYRVNAISLARDGNPEPIEVEILRSIDPAREGHAA
jgi:hypothetical protein